MKFIIKEFVDEKYVKAINILKDNLKENYHIFYGVRLSEFLLPVGEYGSSDFFKDFELINSISLPLVIYDTQGRKVKMIVGFDDMLDKSLLDEAGFQVLIITEFSDLLKNDDLVLMYE
ncbi:DNA distortion polypeptide 3 [Pantoea agglomerans]